MVFDEGMSIVGRAVGVKTLSRTLLTPRFSAVEELGQSGCTIITYRLPNFGSSVDHWIFMGGAAIARSLKQGV
jgi:hypothetical protein